MTEFTPSPVEMTQPAQLPRKGPKSLPAAYGLSAQRRHVLVCNVLPALGTVAAIVWSSFVPLNLFDLGLALAFWGLTIGLGGTVGLHRYFAHGTFETYGVVRIALAIVGAMTAQGPPLAWVTTHRRHHEFSDVEGDPHSPHLSHQQTLKTLRGLWHAHCGWLIGHDLPNPYHYAPDLLADRTFMRINRWYYFWVMLSLCLPAGISFAYYRSAAGFVTGLLWGGLARIFLTSQFVWSVNSICHTFGRRPHATREQSTNNVWLAIPTFGEAWHNNHHAYPYSARFGLFWWQVDLGYCLIKGLEFCRLAWNVKTPTRRQVALLES